MGREKETTVGLGKDNRGGAPLQDHLEHMVCISSYSREADFVHPYVFVKECVNKVFHLPGPCLHIPFTMRTAHRKAWVERNPKAPVPSPRCGAQAAQGPIQPSLEHFQGLGTSTAQSHSDAIPTAPTNQIYPLERSKQPHATLTHRLTPSTPYLEGSKSLLVKAHLQLHRQCSVKLAVILLSTLYKHSLLVLQDMS